MMQIQTPFRGDSNIRFQSVFCVTRNVTLNDNVKFSFTVVQQRAELTEVGMEKPSLVVNEETNNVLILFELRHEAHI